MKEKNNIDIEKLIKLASFTFHDDDKQQLKKELNEFLEYAEILNKSSLENMNLSDLEVKITTPMRDDNIKTWEEPGSIIANSPLVHETSYLVPPQSGRPVLKNLKGEDIKETEIEYEAVIGLEVHAQIKTNSKLFCKCSTNFGKEPNSSTCPVCTGQPGALPVLNREAVNLAILAGLASSSIVNSRSAFTRKNYFYPDLPKGYQITQFELPICSGGYVDIEIDGEKKKITLDRIHLEEDAGKTVYIGTPGILGSKFGTVDFNRSGIPLIEIVTEPVISSSKEAREYVTMLRAILVSLGICDGNMEEGSLRCDANISIRPIGNTSLGVKTEIKNMNSFKAIERALDHEIERQIKLKNSGIPIEHGTMLWDDNTRQTYLMRSKEDSDDYRYFPDPDLLPLELIDKDIGRMRSNLPPLPLERKRKYEETYSFNKDESRLFMINPAYADYFDKVLKDYNNPRVLANWFFNELLSYIDSNIKRLHIKPADMAEFLKRIDCGEISRKIGKSILKKSFDSNLGLIEILEKEGLKQITDPKEIEEIIDSILRQNEPQVEEYMKGKTKVFGYLIGETMKAARGKANPALVNDILKKKLNKK